MKNNMKTINFTPDLRQLDGSETTGLFFVFEMNRLLIRWEADQIFIPERLDLDGCAVELIRKQYIGSYRGQPCYAAETASGNRLAKNFEFKDLRALLAHLDEEMFWIAGRANQLVDWQRTHQYCGTCGLPTEDKKDERAKICLHCGLINYPRLSPAVIVAVTKGDKILLARNKRFKIPFYSVLAGFVEPSETLEQCVHREVKEEVGISVKNIRYFGSQPWPFPNSLMVAFIAEHAGGDIEVDPAELRDAGWFSKEMLPQVPSSISIAGRLIEWFKQRQ
jgi:NAD+ diphosphatase